MSMLFLGLSILLSAVRNILSKEISDLTFGTKQFFLTQACIFICGSLILIFVTNRSFQCLSAQTLLYALAYSILLLAAQYCYTSALKKGNISICSTVYSLGFIFPTLSGSLFWNEKLTGLNIIGILLVIPTIFISGIKPLGRRDAKKANRYIFPLVAAMLSSGGLGIIQKVQQNSPYAEQRNLFVILAFFIAAVISFICSLFAKAEEKPFPQRKAVSAGGIGVAFAFCNLLNTILAGRLDSAMFFPLLNIGTIFASTICGMVFFKEKLTKKTAVVLLIGTASILFITIA